MKKGFGNLRYHILFILIVAIAGLVLVRLFYLQVIKHSFYTALAQNQHEFIEKLIPQRGEIFVQEKNNTWYPLAVNRNYQRVFLVPRDVKEKDEVAQKLAPLVEISPERILEKLKDPEDPYEPLKSKLDDNIAQEISNLSLAGVHLGTERLRWYPQGALAAHVLGFVGFRGNQRVGQYGLEGYYEAELAGKKGFLRSERDALGRWLMLSDYKLEAAQDGANLYLTIDQNIQYVTEQKLREVMEKWQAAEGCAIVLEPKTGAIRAMASWPIFNPNDYNKVYSMEVFLNSCTQKLYEPGSVFKPITMAAGLDTNKISPETTYTDTGFVQIGGYVIRNAGTLSYGLSNMTKVLEKSINTGIVFVEKIIGNQVFKNYVEAFGFDRLLGVDLAGEVKGNLRNLNESREINFATASFGQGISVTPLAMAASIGAIANDGKLMRPFVLEKIVTAGGREQITEPEVISQAIAPRTAGKLTAMLVSTVRNGYDKIRISDYFVAGKTGTAQIPGEGGYTSETSHTFVGYAPAYNPKFLIFLKMEKPKGIIYASDSLAPAFSDLAQYILNYYELPPDE